MIMKMIGSVFELFFTCNEIFKVLNYFIEEKKLKWNLYRYVCDLFFKKGI